MDAKHFDRLARALSERGPRRGLLGLLAILPVLGGLFALLDADETDAKGRRKRRKKRHKHGKGRHKGRRHKRKKPKKPCKPQTITTTCAGGKCGPVQNNCKKTVDCGSCDCPEPCEPCFICQSGPNTPGTCVVDPQQQGEPCGSDGQVCQADGACACTESSCPDCTVCGEDGLCAGCPVCCDVHGDCQDGENEEACGSSGTCDVCTGQEECQNQQCVCVPDCSGKVCGTDGCVGTCGPGCGPGQWLCTDNGTSCACQGDICFGTCAGDAAACCQTSTDCPAATPICVDQVCVPCSGDAPCSDGCCASDGRCQAGTSDGACGAIGGTCDVCAAIEECASRNCVPLACGDGGVCLVFATSTTHQGTLGGLAGADDICQDLADAASLPGAYKAWLSDDTGSPSTRFVQSTGPYRLVDGTTIAANWADLIDGGLLAPIIRTETGQNILETFETFTWTGTAPNGTLSDPTRHCNRWGSDSGLVFGIPGWAASASTTWTESGFAGCDLSERLYCFQQS